MKPATFVAPLGPLVPIVAIVVSLAVVAGATKAQLVGGGTALVIGALLFAVRGNRTSRPASAEPSGGPERPALQR